MPQPFDYSLKASNPIQDFVQNAQIAMQLKEQIKNNALLRAKEESDLRQRELLNQAMAEFNAKPNKSISDYANIANNLPPEQAESYRKTWNMLDSATQKNRLNIGGQIFTAMRSDPKIGIQMLKDQAIAEKNSGNTEVSQEYERWAKIAEVNPNVAADNIGFMIYATPGGKEMMEAYETYGKEERAKKLEKYEIDKIIAETGLKKNEAAKELAQISKLGAETKKIILEAKALDKNGLPIEKRFEMEMKLNNDYVRRVSGLTESKRILSNIQSSAADLTGAGDLALVTSFMKMLDPGSTVRETEFANARDTGGLITTLQNIYQKNKDSKGKFLQPEQRESFARLAALYYDAAQANAAEVKKQLEYPIKNYGLNRENVFGESNSKPTKNESQANVNISQGQGMLNNPNANTPLQEKGFYSKYAGGQ